MNTISMESIRIKQAELFRQAEADRLARSVKSPSAHKGIRGILHRQRTPASGLTERAAGQVR